MRQLIITTGSWKYLTRVWLPSLRQRGEYNGEVLVLDYDYPPEAVEKLKEEKNVTLIKVTKVFNLIPCDRFRAMAEILEKIHQNYDVVMHLDLDTEFFQPIQPLFNYAKEKICYVEEWVANRAWFKPSGIPNIEEWWNKIASRAIINSGMLIGPSKLILEAYKFIAEQLKYKNSWGYDQLLLNVYLYCFDVPKISVERKWNHGQKGYRIEGKVFDLEGEEIAILHKRNV